MGFSTVSVRKWYVGNAFKKYAIWGAIFVFLTSMLAEFLVWTQVVKYWTTDCKLSLSNVTNLYTIIVIAGIFTMPLMGIFADKMVMKFGNEVMARKFMIIFAPVTGVTACVLLMHSKGSTIGIIFACIVFAVYWEIELGGVAGYDGSIYGSKNLGKIWELLLLLLWT